MQHRNVPTCPYRRCTRWQCAATAVAGHHSYTMGLDRVLWSQQVCPILVSLPDQE